MRIAFLVPLMMTGLAACAPALPPVPQAARLTADQLIVTLSDATVCRAPSGPQGGTGRLEACGPGFDYAVTPEASPNLLRRFAEAAFGVLGAEGALAPVGRVVLTDAAGRSYDFVSPVPVIRD